MAIAGVPQPDAGSLPFVLILELDTGSRKGAAPLEDCSRFGSETPCSKLQNGVREHAGSPAIVTRPPDKSARRT
jgi:hypothetical protein